MTDKYINGLDKIYLNLLNPYIDIPISLLEIGVFEGYSLLMFEKMLPKASIYGIDIHCPTLIDSKVVMREINQNDSESLEKFAGEVGGFDIIIDDGSHFTKETKNCFDTLWKYTRKLYVIEDWAIAFAYDLGYYRMYRDRVIGMDNLVLQIPIRFEDISSIEIVYNKKHSYAVYGR